MKLLAARRPTEDDSEPLPHITDEQLSRALDRRTGHARPFAGPEKRRKRT